MDADVETRPDGPGIPDSGPAAGKCGLDGDVAMTDYRIVFHNGIMWVKVNGEIDRAPVHLGDRILIPGEVLTAIGTKRRSSFNPGEPFKYVGKIDDNLLLFHFLSDKQEGPFYPSLYLIDALTLISVNPANGSACDVRV